MRLFLMALLAISLAMTASCTGIETNRSPTATSTSVVSTPGPSLISVPEVVGLKIGAAKHEITVAGLAWDWSVVSGTYTHAAIVQQHPAPGSILQRGATVHIVSGPAESKEDSLTATRRGASHRLCRLAAVSRTMDDVEHGKRGHTTF